MAAWLSGELCIIQAVPKLKEILLSENSFKTELNSLIARKERLNKELTGEKVKDGLLMFGELALKFGLAVISGSSANMSTAAETLKKPRHANGQLTSQKQGEISEIEKKISELNSNTTALIVNATQALKTIRSVNREEEK
ncbi:MAG: hypothetical protein HC862_24335 [Scytonema sp. RU_4_4]|nr:hypothetical protein [Scytonema sp. RU_4_4]